MQKTVDNYEIEAFLVVIALGVVNLLELRDYWSTSEICQVPWHPAIMSLYRFEMISRYIHLCDKSKELTSALPDHFANLETLINS